ncbi:hypothetical protein ACHAPJ_009049 [Fusarium lateritium]
MAEIIGLIASIHTIATAGLAAARAISTIADDLGGAGAEIKGIGIDMRAMAWILQLMKNRLDKMKRVTDEICDLTQQIIAVCKADIRDVEEFLKPLLPQPGKELGFKQKLKWLFAKAKVHSRRAHLETLKTTLNLFISALELMESGNMEEYLKEEVQALLLETQHTRASLLNAKRTETAFQFEEEPLPAKTLQIENGQSESNRPAERDATLPRPILDNTSVEPEDDESKGMLLTNPAPRHKPTDFLGSLSDEDLIKITAHIQLQNRVREFALKIIYPQDGHQNQGGQFQDEHPRRSYEWQDGYDAWYGYDVSRLETISSSSSNLELELKNTKAELNGREKQIEQLKEQIERLDKQIFQLNEQIGGYRVKNAVHEEADKWREREAQVRKDAEEGFRQRMNDVRLAQEDAKREIEKIKIEAEKTARERLEAEKVAEEERTRRNEEVMRQAREEAKLDFEKQLKAAEERGKKEAEERVRAEREARMKFEAELRAAEENRKKEEEERARAEELARVRFEKALSDEKKAKEAAAKKAYEEVERLKKFEVENRAKAEAETLARIEWEKQKAAEAMAAEQAAKIAAEELKKKIMEDAKMVIKESKNEGLRRYFPKLRGKK